MPSADRAGGKPFELSTKRPINSSMIRDIKKRNQHHVVAPLAELASYETITSRVDGLTGMILSPRLIRRDVYMAG